MKPFNAMRLRQPPAAGATDPYFSSVHVLLHFSSLTTDSSSYGRTVAKASAGDSNTFLDTGVFKFSPSSMKAVTGYGVTVANGTLPALSGDFTLECFANFGASAPGSRKVYFSAASGQGFALSQESAGQLSIRVLGSGIVAEGAGSRSDSAWHHIAVVRSGTTLVFYVDGVSRITRTASGTITLAGNDFIVGSDYPNGSGVAWIDDFRLTVGVARYTAAFTPPAAAFPDS